MSVYERDPTTGDLNLVSGMRSLDDCKALMLELCYPVGSVYTSTNNVSPQTFLGGTWISLDGYMLRGATSGVTKNQNQNDGGADSVTVSSVASHNHTQNAHKHSQGSQFYVGLGSNNLSVVYAGQGWNSWGIGSINTDNATATNNANGSNYTVNTLPKYKNVYMWERTA